MVSSLIKKATLGEDLLSKKRKSLLILVGCQLINSATRIVIFSNPEEKKLAGLLH